jgi:hypothetical protein
MFGIYKRVGIQQSFTKELIPHPLPPPQPKEMYRFLPLVSIWRYTQSLHNTLLGSLFNSLDIEQF